MSHARYLIGDVYDRMAELPDRSVDLVLTSPPFLALRSYLPAGHPDKHREIGSETTPAAFLDTLLALTAEWRRLLAPHGSICVELGDTYSGSGGAGGDYNTDGLRSGQPKFRQADGDKGKPQTKGTGGPLNRGGGLTPLNAGPGWPLAKSLCAIPQLYEASLAYGRNLLTGAESPAGQWRVRNQVAWCRPNPPVGALGDKFRPATSYLTIACVSDRRYFDLDAVRIEPTTRPQRWLKAYGYSRGGNEPTFNERPAELEPSTRSNPAGAPPLDWWNIPTHPFPGAHYATFPPALCVRPVLAMCPQRVCTVCGKPSTRIVDAERSTDGNFGTPNAVARSDICGQNFASNAQTTYTTLGWSDCQHDAWRNGLVLDPFAGSGTALAVATGHGRDAIGIDLDPRNADLARQRVGMFLEIDEAMPCDRSGVDTEPTK